MSPTPNPRRRGEPPRRYNFDPLDRIRYHGRDYVYLGETEGGHVWRQHDGQLRESVTHAEMEAIVEDRSFELARGFYAPKSVAARGTADLGSLSDLPEAERDEVTWRTYLCRRFREMESRGEATRSDESMIAAIGLIVEEAGRRNGAARNDYRQRRGQPPEMPQIPMRRTPWPRTLRRWLAAYEAASGNPLALRDGRHRSGNKLPRLGPEAYELLRGGCDAYCSEKRPTIRVCHDGLRVELQALNARRAEQGLEPVPEPSIEALRRAIRALPQFRVHAARHGVDAARRRFRLVKRSVEVLRPGQRVEMDEWLIDLHKLLQKAGAWSKLSADARRAATGRWLVCAAIDCASKVALSAKVAPKATASLAKETLRLALLDKTSLVPGALTPWDMRLSPDMVVTDGGPAFTSHEFTLAVADLGARHDVPPGGMPHLRGTIERWFGTLERYLMPFFTGRAFSDVDEKGEYDAQLRASATPEAIGAALGRWIADGYHNEPHAGLGGETPRQAWVRLTGLYGCCPPPGVHERRAIFGTEFTRLLSLRGVRFLGLHYADERLGADILDRGLFEVTIRVDEDDLGAVSLLTDDGWRTLPCRMRGMEDVTVAEWLVALKDVRARFARGRDVGRAAVLAAVAAVKAIAADAEARVGLQLTVLGPKRIEREEHTLLVGYDDVVLDDDEAPDPTGAVIPIGPGDGGGGGTAGDWLDAPRRRFGSEEE